MARPRSTMLFPFECDPLERRQLLSGDHPSLASFPDATVVPLDVIRADSRSSGLVAGEIATTGDDDLFRFVVPDGFTSGVVVAAQARVGGLAPAIQILNQDGSLFGGPIDADNGLAGTSTPVGFIAGRTYYVNVRAGTPSNANEPDVTGGYSLLIFMAQTSGGVGAPAPIPGAPPNTEPLPISPVTGRGSTAGMIVGIPERNDYYIVVPSPGGMLIDVETPESEFDPKVTLMSRDGEILGVSHGDADRASLTYVAPRGNEGYIIRIEPEDGAPEVRRHGWFTVTVDTTIAPAEPPAPPPVGPPPAAPPQPEEFETAGSIDLNTISGAGEALGASNFAGTPIMYRFTSRSVSRATLGLERAVGSEFIGALRVYNAARTQIAFDANVSAGRLANLTLPSNLGDDFFVRIEPIARANGRDGAAGEFVLRILTDPTEHVLYYPEGFSSGTIDEYVPLVNPNTYPVSYSIIAHYEVGERDQVLSMGTLAPISRGGITITSRRTPGASLVRPDTPYALEVRSNGPIGATLSHYDFGATTGENFTNRLDRFWSFAQARKMPGEYAEFIVYYNPNPNPVSVRMTLIYEDGEQVEIIRVVDSFRRGGINFNADPDVTRHGSFSVRVQADQPIVAALSSYGLEGQGGFGILGDTGGGDRRGAIPTFRTDRSATDSIVLFNPNAQAADVILTITSLNNLASNVRFITVQPRQRITLHAAELSLPDLGPLGLRYESNAPVSVMSSEQQSGDADAAGAGHMAAMNSVIADAFINPALAGTLYQESLTFYNPSSQIANVNITFMLPGGLLGSTSISVGARTFVSMDVDQLSMMQLLRGPSALAIRISASTPVIAGFTHYDLFLQGGWSTLAAPLGLATGLGGF